MNSFHYSFVTWDNELLSVSLLQRAQTESHKSGLHSHTTHMLHCAISISAVQHKQQFDTEQNNRGGWGGGVYKEDFESETKWRKTAGEMRSKGGLGLLGRRALGVQHCGGGGKQNEGRQLDKSV